MTYVITNENIATKTDTADCDFTEQHYRHLLRIAKGTYRFVTYDAIPWHSHFVLWRHDLDFSINRAASLSIIESEEDVIATYFINPHSEFYNPFEASQAKLIEAILMRGHRLGLHIDAVFHKIQGEPQLHDKVSEEARWLEQAFGVRPDAFSFHNPTAIHLRCDQESYGGLINCYSRRFKTEVPYCSDSNGYWRFRRLHDVLTEACDPCLQVLTHPGWWQNKTMSPRQRVFRAAHGRAKAAMLVYDAVLRAHCRINHAGPADALDFLRDINHRKFELCDYLWNEGQYQTLFLELVRLHEAQMNRFCKAVFRQQWRVAAQEVNLFFSVDGPGIDGWRLFRAVFDGETWQSVTGTDEPTYQRWVGLRNQLVLGRSSAAPAELEQGCVYLCGLIQRLADWGRQSALAYDGLAHLGCIGLPTIKTAESDILEEVEAVRAEIPRFPNDRWRIFQEAIKLNQVTP